MINKVIHYCWFGKKKLPEEAIKCIESWKHYCPDYEIIEWNEDNYDVNKNKYMSDAYKEKKWAFVSDYARIDIIYTYGGVYFDVDVELVAPIDSFLNDGLFCGWENRDALIDKIGQKYENSVAFGLGFGAEKGHPVLKKILDLYETLSFYNEDGTFNLIACPKYQTKVLVECGLSTRQRTFQKFMNVVVYPEDYFSPKSILTGKIKMTHNTVAIHHFSMSWVDKETKKTNEIKWRLCEVFPYQIACKMADVLSIPLRCKRKLKKILQ